MSTSLIPRGSDPPEASRAPTAQHRRDLCDTARFVDDSAGTDTRTLVPLIYRSFDARSWREAPTSAIAWDLSADLDCWWPATSPTLLATFLRIRASERLMTQAAATAQLFAVIDGVGATVGDGTRVEWEAGDLFCLPSSGVLAHEARGDAVLLHVHDEPLLRHLGAAPAVHRFRATHYQRHALEAQLTALRVRPGTGGRGCRRVRLGNADVVTHRWSTHVLGATVEDLSPGCLQQATRSPRATLNLCTVAAPGAATVLARRMDGAAGWVDPIRIDWVRGSAFLIPPDWWFAHENRSPIDARLLTVDDAGVEEWMRRPGGGGP